MNPQPFLRWCHLIVDICVLYILLRSCASLCFQHHLINNLIPGNISNLAVVPTLHIITYADSFTSTSYMYFCYFVEFFMAILFCSILWVTCSLELLYYVIYSLSRVTVFWKLCKKNAFVRDSSPTWFCYLPFLWCMFLLIRQDLVKKCYGMSKATILNFKHFINF